MCSWCLSGATEMVHALIDAAYDKEPHVQDVICNSLCEVGKKRPNLVLSSCHGYLLKHSKVGTAGVVRGNDCY